MKVLKFSYEFREIDGFDFNPVKTELIEFCDTNLLVGKNASGKSTIVSELYNLADILKGTSPGLQLGKYYIELEYNPKVVYKYFYNVTIKPNHGGIEISEKLEQNDSILINRHNSEAEIYSNNEKTLIKINPPTPKLVHQVRRDEKDHPYLEHIIIWAESVHSFKFGHIHSSSFIRTNVDKSSALAFDELTSLKGKDLNIILNDLNDESKSKIISEFNSLNYDVELMNIKDQALDKDIQSVIYIKENNLKYEIHQSKLSQGMFRTLFLLIFIHHLIEKEKAGMIIIDDLCEGLDYDRATKLGKLIFSKMHNSKIQFIATSNDYFLMNAVDVKSWNIIYREGNVIKVNNYCNNKDKFDNFRLSGLNNFDLFSSNYLD